ncbi:MAG: serine hydroxymethyltransferase [Patescibacteria group bacterium]
MLKKLIQKEALRQRRVINFIPSENYVSKNVLAALGSPLTNKYAEGQAHRRYYFGNQIIDEIEDEVKKLVYKCFKVTPAKYGVNVQPYSGSIANLAAYLGALVDGDPEKLRNGASRILAMSLAHGGHLTHGHSVSWTGKLFNFRHYGVGRDGWLDYDAIAKLAKQFKPKLIVCGATAYPRKIDFKKFRRIADSVGALLMADISHIAGLVVGGAYPSPFPYADIVTTTTHKTLRGPRGAIIISKKELADKIDKTIFPGLQGGPQMHTIAAIGVCLEEALHPSFKKYVKQVVVNAKALAGELRHLGVKVISGGTDNHLLLVDVTPLGISGKTAGERLEKHGIIVNKNAIPYDIRQPWDPSGIRLGTPAVTTRGMREKDMIKIARRIRAILMTDS